MNAKISMFVICVEAITYLFLRDLHDCTFNLKRIFINELNHLVDLSKKELFIGKNWLNIS